MKCGKINYDLYYFLQYGKFFFARWVTVQTFGRLVVILSSFVVNVKFRSSLQKSFFEQSRKGEISSIVSICRSNSLCRNKVGYGSKTQIARKTLYGKLSLPVPANKHQSNSTFHQHGWTCLWPTPLVLLLNQGTRWSANSHWSEWPFAGEL